MADPRKKWTYDIKKVMEKASDKGALGTQKAKGAWEAFLSNDDDYFAGLMAARCAVLTCSHGRGVFKFMTWKIFMQLRYVVSVYRKYRFSSSIPDINGANMFRVTSCIHINNIVCPIPEKVELA